VANAPGGLTVSAITSGPANGKVSINTDNTVTYVPNVDFAGIDIFTYKVVNSLGYTKTATVTVTVTNDGCDGGILQSSTGSVTLPAIADTYLNQGSLTNNYGAGLDLSINHRDGSRVMRSIIKFDESTFPAGAIATSATLRLYSNRDDGQFATNVHAITSTWTEGTGTGTNNIAANWTNRVEAVTDLPWTTAGGDFNSTILATLASFSAVNTYSEWTSAALGTQVQNWKSTPASNFGLIIKPTPATEGVSGSADDRWEFNSREEASNKPELVVNYYTCAAIPARAPLGNQDTASTLSTTPVTFNVSNNDNLFSAAATALTISTAPIAAQGTASANLATGDVTFTPNATFNGVATFQYTVTTANGSDVVRVYVIVNNAPLNANDDNPTGQNSGNTQTISVLSNDVDPEGAALTVTILTQPTNGTATVNGSNQVVYTPNTGFTGTDVLTYRVCEPSPTCGSPYCDDAVLNLIVLNQPPVGTPDSKTVLPCLATTINLLSNDTDPEGQVLTISSLSALSDITAGTLVNNNDGTVTFTPTPGYSGVVTFTYSILDNGVPPMTSLTPATVTITVNNPVNTAPIALNDAESTNMEQKLYASILDNDSDPENQELTIPVITIAPLHGTATVLANGLIEYTPNPGFSGTDALTYQICDKVINPAICSTAPGLCTTATLAITVDAPNTVIAINDENSTWVNTPVSGATLTNDFDPEGDLPLVFGGFIIGGTAYTSGTHTISGVDATGAPVPDAGTLTINADGTYTFTPANNFTGSINVPYVLNDSNPNTASDTAYLRITVNPVPTGTNSVIANNDEISTLPNTTVSSTLFTNDRDPQANSFTVTSYLFDNNGDGIADQSGTIGAPIVVGGITTAGTPVANAGTLTINADGTYTFVPAADFSGVVDVPYTITDALGATSTAILHIDILPDINGSANDRPLPGDDFVYTAFDTPVNSTFINNDTDPNANPVSLNGTPINTGGPATPIGSPVATAQGGTVQFYANGTYTYTPPSGYTGPDRVVYEVCDVTAINPQPLCANATIHMLVAPSLSTLPATGLKVTASLQGVIATIKWETLSEQNTDYFILERSLDNSSFTPIGTAVDAAGNSVSKQVYQQGDDISSLVQQSIIYYRVRLADVDGKMKYSNVAAVRLNKAPGITVWPNPFTTSISVTITSSQNTELMIRITDMAGRSISTNNQQVPRGIAQVSINNLDHLANGVYMLEVTDKNSGSRTVHKLIKEQ
jgi:hypothetical protein